MAISNFPKNRQWHVCGWQRGLADAFLQTFQAARIVWDYETLPRIVIDLLDDYYFAYDGPQDWLKRGKAEQYHRREYADQHGRHWFWSLKRADLSHSAPPL